MKSNPRSHLSMSVTTQDPGELINGLTKLIIKSTDASLTSQADSLISQLQMFTRPKQATIEKAQLLLERHGITCQD